MVLAPILKRNRRALRSVAHADARRN